MVRKVSLVLGKSVYAVGYSELFAQDATLEEVTGREPTFKKLSSFDIPFLEPLKIVAAKYTATMDGVVLKVKLHPDQYALSFTNRSQLDVNKDAEALKQLSGLLLPVVPSDRTAREIEAIKRKQFFRGMSENALHYSLGFAKSENDWGSGGKQLIYSDHFIVYLDEQDKIVDWQLLDSE